MQNTRILNPKIILLIAALVVAGTFTLWFLSKGTGAINPNTDELLNPDDGRLYAAIYKHGELYDDINENDDVLRLIQTDLMLFARTTRAEFNNQDNLVGFTIKDRRQEGEAFVYNGFYYGFNDKIQLIITPHGKGVFTLSITNLVDNTNIDEYLSMNGVRNKYLQDLPIESDYYSIRYQLAEDRIVVTFYDGYREADTEAVRKSISEGLGDETGNVVYTLNRVGILTLSEIEQRLKP